jgi:hypothetical protein
VVDSIYKRLQLQSRFAVAIGFEAIPRPMSGAPDVNERSKRQLIIRETSVTHSVTEGLPAWLPFSPIARVRSYLQALSKQSNKPSKALSTDHQSLISPQVLDLLARHDPVLQSRKLNLLSL